MPAPRPADRTGKARPVAALERGLLLMRVRAESPLPLTHGQIALRAGISKPTLTRLVGTLVGQGLVSTIDGTEKYRLGPGVLPWARSFLAGLDYRAAARPHLAALAEATGGWTYLGVPDGEAIVVVETARAQANVLLARLDVGSRLALATSAVGRAYLAACEPDERARLVARIPAALRSIATRAAQTASRTGFAISIGAWHRDINTVGVAIRGPRDELLLVNCGGPAFAFPVATLRSSVAPRLRRTAVAIAAAIGGSLALPGNASRGRRSAT